MKIIILFFLCSCLVLNSQPVAPGSVLYTDGSRSAWTRVGATIGGNTYNQTVAPGTTTFWPLWTQGQTNQLTDSSSGTRNILTEPTILTNLYFYATFPAGVGKTNILTILTNGISTTMTAKIGGATITKATNTTEYLTILAGTEVGVNITTAPLAVPPSKFSWAVSLKQ